MLCRVSDQDSRTGALGNERAVHPVYVKSMVMAVMVVIVVMRVVW